MALPMQLKKSISRPIPVLQISELDRLNGRATQAQVGVAPSTEAYVATEVFVADVEAADEGFASVGHNDFSVVAEVQLQPRPPETIRSEGMALDAGFLEFAQVFSGKFVGADFVKNEVNADSGAGAFDERILEAVADSVVLYDEEVDQ